MAIKDFGKIKVNQVGSFKIKNFEDLEKMVNDPESDFRKKFK